jgi:Flp pilus assembly protein TadD
MLASGAAALFTNIAMVFVKQYCQAAVAVLALGVFPLSAQTSEQSSNPAISGSTFSNDPSDQLAANLMILSQRPRDVNALIGAGLSAIAIGDGNAALGFLARAEEISPTNGRIKAALGSALLLVERPAEALKLFGEASALGIPDRELARDRGLAFDLRGDTRRAQRDYAIALDYSREDEVIRRMALSLGISGDRDRALALLDPLLRKQDQAAWRARAFVLAMNGDIRGAESIAGSVMPQGSIATMAPFLRRLASLNAAERALAVNFGTIASDGQQFAQVQTDDPFRPVTTGTSGGAGQGLIPAGDQFGPRPATAVKPPVQVASNDPRRRPGREENALAAPKVETAVLGTQRVGKRIGPVDPALTRPNPQQVAVVTKMTSLPPPDSAVRPAPSAQPSFSSIFIAAKDVVPVPATPPAAAVAAKVPNLPAAAPTPSAIGQVPATAMVKPPVAQFEVPPAAQLPQAVTKPPTPAPQPVQVALSSPPASFPPIPLPPASSLPAPNPLPKVIAAPSSPAFIGPPAIPTPSSDAVPANVSPLVPVPPPVAIAAVTSPVSPVAAVASGEPVSTPSAVPAVPDIAPAPAQIVVAQPVSPAPTGLGAIIAAIEPEIETTAVALPSASEIRAARLAVKRKAEAAAKLELAEKLEKEEREAARAEAAKSPARIWVQVAGGSNRAGLTSTWKKTREAAPALLKGASAWSTPLNRTNRLLVGPFKSNNEARDMVNKLNKAGLSVFAFTSTQGQEIEKLSTR